MRILKVSMELIKKVEMLLVQRGEKVFFHVFLVLYQMPFHILFHSINPLSPLNILVVFSLVVAISLVYKAFHMKYLTTVLLNT